MYNCHIHTFTDQDVPDRYLPASLARILKTKIGAKVLTGGLKNLIPFTDGDLFDKYARFITIGKLRDQGKIFHECAKYYPRHTRFLIHAMDMEFMGAGKTDRPYRAQLEELGKLALNNEQVIPFMMVDPRRLEVRELLQEMHERYGFHGIKLYPTLGYFPYDPRLRPVYQYCVDHRLAVMAHCGPYNPTYFKGSSKDLLILLEGAHHPIDPGHKTNAELCTYFTHPHNYPEILQEFPELNICLAHFGGGYYWDRYIHNPEDDDNWFSIIKDLIRDYPNLYTDISFTLSDLKYFSLLKVLLADPKIRRKVLFGSDYYMVRTKSEERRFGLDVRAFIGEENFRRIAGENVEEYLGIWGLRD